MHLIARVPVVHAVRTAGARAAERSPENQMEKVQTTPAVVAASGYAVTRVMGRIGRMCRMFVFFLTAGFAYPNVWIEGMDLASIQSKSEGDLYAKKKK